MAFNPAYDSYDGYDGYDNYNDGYRQPGFRRQSLSYGAPPMGLPQHQAMYPDQMMPPVGEVRHAFVV